MRRMGPATASIASASASSQWKLPWWVHKNGEPSLGGCESTVASRKEETQGSLPSSMRRRFKVEAVEPIDPFAGTVILYYYDSGVVK